MVDVNPTELLIVLALIATPLATLGMVAMLRGYHLTMRLWRGDAHRPPPEAPEDS